MVHACISSSKQRGCYACFYQQFPNTEKIEQHVFPATGSVEERLENLEVFCPFRSEGCNIICKVSIKQPKFLFLQRSELSNHLESQCQFITYNCPNYHCGCSFKSREIQKTIDHIVVCIYTNRKISSFDALPDETIEYLLSFLPGNELLQMGMVLFVLTCIIFIRCVKNSREFHLQSFFGNH